MAGNLPKHCRNEGPAVSFLARNNDSQILQSLERFWEAETIPDNESACEEHFVRSTQRNHEGRFIVSLPFKFDNPHLGESYTCLLYTSTVVSNMYHPTPRLIFYTDGIVWHLMILSKRLFWPDWTTAKQATNGF